MANDPIPPVTIPPGTKLNDATWMVMEHVINHTGTIGEAAVVLGVAPATIRKWLRDRGKGVSLGAVVDLDHPLPIRRTG